MNQPIYTFGISGAQGDASMKKILGAKGANLAELAKLKLPVPAGFTVATHHCEEFLENQKIGDDLKKQILEGVKFIENETNKKLGGTSNPLLVSVRSGAPVSMPGMLDTILNVGFNDKIVDSLASSKGK